MSDYVFALTKGPYGNIIALCTDKVDKSEILKININEEYPIVGRWHVFLKLQMFCCCEF